MNHSPKLSFNSDSQEPIPPPELLVLSKDKIYPSEPDKLYDKKGFRIELKILEDNSSELVLSQKFGNSSTTIRTKKFSKFWSIFPKVQSLYFKKFVDSFKNTANTLFLRKKQMQSLRETLLLSDSNTSVAESKSNKVNDNSKKMLEIESDLKFIKEQLLLGSKSTSVSEDFLEDKEKTDKIIIRNVKK